MQMEFDGVRQPNTQYVLSLSYGKDSMASIHVIRDVLNWPLDRIVTAQVWATDSIPADLPPMYEFKEQADKIIKERYGIDVEHFCATRKIQAERETEDGGSHSQKFTYERGFYNKMRSGKFVGNIYGFPKTTAGWCKKLKVNTLREVDL